MTVSTENTISTYGYDPLNRLTSHELSGTPHRQRFYCKSRLATEIEGANSYSVVQHENFLLAQQQRESEARETSLLDTDLQRSVLHTLKQSLRQTIAYTAYGHRCAESGRSSLLGFNGERTDPVTGHYLLGNGYRAFNPVLMRFNSPDKFSPFGKGGINAYIYCTGDPINYTDPSGTVGVNWLKLRTGVFSNYGNLPSRFMPLAGVSNLEYKSVLNRLSKIDEAIESFESRARFATYQSDRYAALGRKPLESISLQRISLAKIQPNMHPPQTPHQLEKRFGKPASTVIGRLMDQENISAHRPVLEELHKMNVKEKNLQRTLMKILNETDVQGVLPYIKRLDASIPIEVANIRAKRSELIRAKLHDVLSGPPTAGRGVRQ